MKRNIYNIIQKQHKAGIAKGYDLYPSEVMELKNNSISTTTAILNSFVLGYAQGSKATMKHKGKVIKQFINMDIDEIAAILKTKTINNNTYDFVKELYFSQLNSLDMLLVFSALIDVLCEQGVLV